MEIRKLILLVICMGFVFVSYPQTEDKTFRKCYIVAYKSNSKFSSTEQNTNLKNSLISLFNNQKPEQTDNQQIQREGNYSDFFNSEIDDILFFDFGISEDKTIRRNISQFPSLDDKTGIFNYFIDNYFCLQSQYSVNVGSIDDFLDDCLSKCRKNTRGVVSPSSYVFPLILAKVSPKISAEEYYLIMISDYNDPTGKGQNEESNRLNEVIGINAREILDTCFINPMRNKINQQERFQYRYVYYPEGRYGTNYKRNYVYLVVSKITPENIVPPTIESNIKFEQLKYGDDLYKRDAVKIRFPHSDNLCVNSIYENISEEKGSILKTRIEQVKEAGFYIIPLDKIELADFVRNKNFNSLDIKYIFNAQLQLLDTPDCKLGLVYKVKRLLFSTDIIYKTETSIIIMNYIVLPLGIFLLILIVILIFANRGKPQGLRFTIQRYLDSFEKTDFNKDGKLITDYKSWDYNKQKEDLLPVNGVVEFKANKYPFNWNSKIKLQLNVEKSPQGFELFLKEKADDISEYGTDYVMVVRPTKTGEFSFWVGIRQTDINKEINDPELVKFSVKAVLQDSFAFVKADIRESSFENTFGSYLFHIGQNLQDVWVAFDPGTTGSCVAIGSEANNIRLLNEKNDTKGIVPSVITFDMKQSYVENIKPIYAYGADALLDTESDRFVIFKSIKKMLGFKTERKINFKNNTELSLKGKDLASYLVEGLYKGVGTEFNNSAYKDDYIRNNEFKPLRAVVAIPNNFTATKIQEMEDCIANLRQFKEIRYVYEAEAVLFHYLSTNNVENYETILVFDMGGATINATVAAVNKFNDGYGIKHDIDILGKIGYGIGGDTIDYCILKFLMSFPTEFRELSNILSNFKNKEQMYKLAFAIKKEIVHNYDKKYNYLITADTLKRYIKECFPEISDSSLRFEWNEVKAVTDTEGLLVQKTEKKYSKMYDCFLKKNNTYPLFEHQVFRDIIYDNVKDAVKEVLELANVPVDKIIFAGRSTAFPLIKDTVEKQAGKKGSNVGTVFNDLKTAVAKGSCWYGIHRNAILLHNLKTTAAFGYKETMNSNRTDVRFHQLIAMGQNFDTNNNGISFYRQSKNLAIPASFNLDSLKVNFYQIMGKNADAILSQDQKHKYSKIATIPIDHFVTEIAMQVNENDNIDCIVRLETTRKIFAKGVVEDQEINEENAEHYTWII